MNEHNSNQYTKENDKIKQYLLRIIQRYFDIEYEYNQKNIESIIVESITRLKREFLDEKGLIFSLNKKTGNVILTITDLGGEHSFSKNTAFNKDFGIEADTICEGNDSRLSDPRVPLEHNHTIGDVNGLAELLNVEIPLGSHSHKNKKILDALRYTGSRVEIDLALIDALVAMVNEYIKNLRFVQDKLNDFQVRSIEQLGIFIEQLVYELDTLHDYINFNTNWVQEIKDYTDIQCNEMYISIMANFNNYLSKEELAKLESILNKAELIVSEGEFPLVSSKREFSFNEQDIIIDSEDISGDALIDIYNSGIRLGRDDWRWDSSIQAFVYNYNEQDSYPRFISINAFDVYTHRVTLTALPMPEGQFKDNDNISVVLAYNSTTGEDLSFICTVGGEPIGNSGAQKMGGYVRYNYYGSNDTVLNIPPVILRNTDSILPWEDIKITVLIKRNKENFKIWIGEEQDIRSHLDVTTDSNGKKNIYPDMEPNLDFNITDFTQLSNLNKACNYGYGNHSQQNSTYLDIYFTSPGPVVDEKYGDTDLSSGSITEKTISTSITANIKNAKMKTFIRYTKDGITHQEQLPLIDIKDSGDVVVIQPVFNENKMSIEAKVINNLDFYITDKNIYNNDTVIYASAIFPDTYDNILSMLKAKDRTMSQIDAAKNSFILNNKLLPDNGQYFINGTMYTGDDELYDDDGNIITVGGTWDTNNPNTNMSSVYTYHVVYGFNKKLKTVSNNTKCGYVAEFKIKSLEDYYPNAKIYYQVIGSKEA